MSAVVRPLLRTPKRSQQHPRNKVAEKDLSSSNPLSQSKRNNVSSPSCTNTTWVPMISMRPKITLAAKSQSVSSVNGQNGNCSIRTSVEQPSSVSSKTIVNYPSPWKKRRLETSSRVWLVANNHTQTGLVAYPNSSKNNSAHSAQDIFFKPSFALI